MINLLPLVSSLPRQIHQNHTQPQNQTQDVAQIVAKSSSLSELAKNLIKLSKSKPNSNNASAGNGVVKYGSGNNGATEFNSRGFNRGINGGVFNGATGAKERTEMMKNQFANKLNSKLGGSGFVTASQINNVGNSGVNVGNINNTNNNIYTGNNTGADAFNSGDVGGSGSGPKSVRGGTYKGNYRSNYRGGSYRGNYRGGAGAGGGTTGRGSYRGGRYWWNKKK